MLEHFQFPTCKTPIPYLQHILCCYYQVIAAQCPQVPTSVLSKELTRDTVYVMYTQGPERTGTSCAGALDFFDIGLFHALKNAA